MEKEVSESGPFVSVLFGVTGMAGLSLAEALKSPKALGGSWKVYGSARRPMPTWFPCLLLDRYIAFDATDAGDTDDKLASISDEVTHVFWVAIQVRENEEGNICANGSMLANVLNVLKSGPAARLSHITLQTGTRHYMNNIAHEPPFTRICPACRIHNFTMH